MKRLLIILLLTIQFLFMPFQTASAYTTKSNTVTTRVGNPPTAPHPTPPDYPPDLIAAIKDKFGIIILANNGGASFTQDQLKLIWEEFWAASNTNLFNLNIKGVTIRPDTVVSCPDTNDRYLGCAYSGFSNDPSASCPQNSMIDEKVGVDPNTFSLDLFHELGHIVDSCNTREVSHEVDVQNAYSSEGGISAYAAQTNYYEDYAEMTTFYFNTDIPVAGTSANPFANGGFPITYNIAKTVYGDY